MNPSKFRKQQEAPQKKQPTPATKAAKQKKKGKSFLGIIISDIKNLLLIVEDARKEPDDCWENWEDQL
jgi:hypothetical protein